MGTIIRALFSRTFWGQINKIAKFFMVGNVIGIRTLSHRGARTTITPSAAFAHSENIYLGDDVLINHHCRIYAASNAGITLRNRVMLGPGVFITSDAFEKSRDETEAIHTGKIADVVIEENVRVGAYAIILPGVIIGRGCAVGAGAVVTKSMPPGSIVAGNPARVVGTRQPS